MIDTASLLGAGAQRIVELLNRYLDARRATRTQRRELLRDLHGALLAVDADYLWVGTTAGLVRFRRSEVRP